MSEPTLFYDSINKSMASSVKEKLALDAVALLKSCASRGGSIGIKSGTITPDDNEIALSDILTELYSNCLLIVAQDGRDTSLGAKVAVGALFVGTTTDNDTEIKATISTVVNSSADAFVVSSVVMTDDVTENNTIDFATAVIRLPSGYTFTGTYDWYAW